MSTSPFNGVLIGVYYRLLRVMLPDCSCGLIQSKQPILYSDMGEPLALWLGFIHVHIYKMKHSENLSESVIQAKLFLILM